MSVNGKRAELRRLQELFQKEADKFPDLSLTVVYMTQRGPVPRKFSSPHHFIMLWQYYGQISAASDIDALVRDIETSDLKLIGLRGSQFSCFAIVEGEAASLFAKMARRAGSVFSEAEAAAIKHLAREDFESNATGIKPGPGVKEVFVQNDDAMAVWLNFVLARHATTHPRYLPEVRIALDPFAASLAAVDHLLMQSGLGRDESRARSPFEEKTFQVALSFPGKKRGYVAQVAKKLLETLGDGCVFYDQLYEPELARPNLDVLLQRIYRTNATLVAVFLCADYESSEWCGLEWRAVRALIKEKADATIMIFRFDDAPVAGLLSIDGYIDAQQLPPEEAARAIIERLKGV